MYRPSPALWLSRLAKLLLIRYLEARHGRARMMKLLLDHHLKRHYLRAPEIELTEGKIRLFASMFEAAVRGDTGEAVNYQGAYPKYEFLHYLVERRGLLLHGSNESELELLRPLRKSSDTKEYGNLASVYACSDGVWPIFYALVNRKGGERCAISTSCVRLDSEEGARKLYSFSIETKVRPTELWKNGTVYVVGREKFKRLRDPTGYVLEEWACAEGVRPLTKLTVSPADFPFLKETRVHGFANAGPGPRSGSGVRTDGSYEGQYEIDGGLRMTVADDLNCLYIRLAEYPPLIFDRTSDKTFTRGETQIIFEKDAGGEVTRMTFRLLGRDIPARRVA